MNIIMTLGIIALYLLACVPVVLIAGVRKRERFIWMWLSIILTPVLGLILILMPVFLVDKLEWGFCRFSISLHDGINKWLLCEGARMARELLVLADLRDAKLLTNDEILHEKERLIRRLDKYGTADDYCQFLHAFKICAEREILTAEDISKIKYILDEKNVMHTFSGD